MESRNKSCHVGLFCYLEIKNIFQISAYRLDYRIKLNIIKICSAMEKSQLKWRDYSILLSMCADDDEQHFN